MSIYFGADDTVLHSGNVGGGKILQVQSTIKRNTVGYVLNSSGTSMSYSSQIMSVSITPSNSNNKILITGFLTASANYTDRLHIRLLKNGSELSNASATAEGSHRRRGHASINIDATRHQSTPINFLDTADQTSAITYGYNIAQGCGGQATVYINRQGNGFSDEANRFLSCSVITAMEIEV